MINPLDDAARMREHNSRAEKISSQVWAAREKQKKHQAQWIEQHHKKNQIH